MSTDQHKALLRRFIDLWNTGHTRAADEFVSPDLVDHSLPPGMPPGLEGFKLLVQTFRSAFPDLQITIDELAAQDDRATARVTFRGTHQGEFQGIAPTGKTFTMAAIGMLRFADALVMEHWAVLDLLGLLQQLGVAPAMSDAPYQARWPASGAYQPRDGDTTANLAVVRRFFDEVCNNRQLDTAQALFAPQHRYHDPSIPGVADGPAGILQPDGPVQPYQSAFSDAHWHVEDMITEDDLVITRWYGTGVQDGALPGIPAAGGQVQVPGMWWQRLANGQIVESWQVWDTLAMLQQLGAIPTPSAVHS
jgi:steroid delta-isomerase-like uncharacterized protein